MSESLTDIELISILEVAQALGVPVSRIHQYLREGALLALRDVHGARGIPAAFVQDRAVVKGLSGVVTLLRDARYSDDEIITWLFRADDSLPGTPIQALRDNRGGEVKRRAQAAGY